MILPVDKRIIAKIQELVVEGHRSANTVKAILDDYVSKELAPEASKINRRFYPRIHDIQNHIYHALPYIEKESVEPDESRDEEGSIRDTQEDMNHDHFVCGLCQQTSISLMDFLAHKLNHINYGARLACEICRASFHKHLNLAEHYKRKHRILLEITQEHNQKISDECHKRSRRKKMTNEHAFEEEFNNLNEVTTELLVEDGQYYDITTMETNIPIEFVDEELSAVRNKHLLVTAQETQFVRTSSGNVAHVSEYSAPTESTVALSTIEQESESAVRNNDLATADVIPIVNTSYGKIAHVSEYSTLTDSAVAVTSFEQGSRNAVRNEDLATANETQIVSMGSGNGDDVTEYIASTDSDVAVATFEQGQQTDGRMNRIKQSSQPREPSANDLECRKNPLNIEACHSCSECGAVFVSLRFLKKHMSLHRNEPIHLCDENKKKTKNSKSHTVTGDCYQCSQCNFSSTTNSEVLVHQQFHSNGIVLCHICRCAYTDISDLSKHKKVHDVNQPVPCKFPGCTWRFKSEELCQTHYEANTAEGKFKCSKCICLCSHTHQLLTHEKEAHGIQPTEVLAKKQEKILKSQNSVKCLIGAVECNSDPKQAEKLCGVQQNIMTSQKQQETMKSQILVDPLVNVVECSSVPKEKLHGVQTIMTTQNQEETMKSQILVDPLVNVVECSSVPKEKLHSVQTIMTTQNQEETKKSQISVKCLINAVIRKVVPKEKLHCVQKSIVSSQDQQLTGKSRHSVNCIVNAVKCNEVPGHEEGIHDVQHLIVSSQKQQETAKSQHSVNCIVNAVQSNIRFQQVGIQTSDLKTTDDKNAVNTEISDVMMLTQSQDFGRVKDPSDNKMYTLIPMDGSEQIVFEGGPEVKVEILENK